MWNTRRAAPHRCQMVTLAWFGVGAARRAQLSNRLQPTAFSPTSMPTRNASPLLFKNRQLALRLLTGLAGRRLGLHQRWLVPRATKSSCGDVRGGTNVSAELVGADAKRAKRSSAANSVRHWGA